MTVRATGRGAAAVAPSARHEGNRPPELDERNADKRCRLGQTQRPVQVEQADAEVDDDVQHAEEHRRQADPEPYRHPPVAAGPRELFASHVPTIEHARRSALAMTRARVHSSAAFRALIFDALASDFAEKSACR
jgi:hypothetical protein